MTTPNRRVASIDILRAITMVLMIFVNEFWSLKDIPDWLKHVAKGVDGMGFADVIFPAFLFIVGLSLPYAIDARRKKGDTDLQLVGHVIVRSIALLVMGMFLGNGTGFNQTAAGMPRYLWNPLCCAAFILIWNNYSNVSRKALILALRGLGITVLLALAWVYRGGTNAAPFRFDPHNWSILGQIGWAYLASGIITIFARNRFLVVLGGWTIFAALSVITKTITLPAALYFIPSAIIGGTITGLTMGGVLTALIFQHYRERQNNRTMTLAFLGFAALWTALFFATRQAWGLSKIGATPAWLFICSAITVLAFTAIYWIADVKQKAGWFNFIRPAGTDTLLCYLVPYVIYSIMRGTNFQWPSAIVFGWIGLLKAFLFALLCVTLVRGLTRLGVRLKV